LLTFSCNCLLLDATECNLKKLSCPPQTIRPHTCKTWTISISRFKSTHLLGGKFVLLSTLVGPAFYIILGFIFLGFFILFLVHQVLHDPKKEEKKISFHDFM
jgi:hypothetical protein